MTNIYDDGHGEGIVLKKWIALLLAITCIASILVFFSYSPPDRYQLREAAQIDSLISRTFDQFNLHDRQIRTRTIQIDSVLSRKVYTVEVPAGFSKTQWHYELDKNVRPYGIETPGSVELPDEDLQIQLAYGQNIIRTVILRTDPDLMLYRDFATLILSFEQPPSQRTLNRIYSLGEPISIAIRTHTPRQAYEGIRDLRRQYPNTAWWLQQNDGVSFDDRQSINLFINQLSRIEQLDSGSQILFFNSLGEDLASESRNRLRSLNLRMIDVGEALFLDDLSDPDRRRQINRELLQRSSVRKPPVVIIEGTDANIQQLQSYITALKEENIQLRRPTVIEF